MLSGGGGDDTIKGGDGNDLIAGDFPPFADGFDKLSGGKGNDVFQFVIPSGIDPIAYDKIKDFKPGEDMIGLFDFSHNLGVGYLNKDFFHKGTSAANPDQQIIYDKKTGSIYTDNDGSGAGSQQLFAKVKAGTHLDAHDFFVYPVLFSPL